jgi:hypothetical protein
MDCNLYYLIPQRNGFAPVSLRDKYIATATVLRYTFARKRIAMVIHESGPFVVFSRTKPKFVKVDGDIITEWSFQSNVVTLDAPGTTNGHTEIELFY